MTFHLPVLPRDLRQEGIRQAHGSWFRLSFVYNHYLFFACILVVLLAIILYLLRLRRIHHRQTRPSAPLDLLWIEEVVPMIGVQVGPWGQTKTGEAQVPQNAAYWIPSLSCFGLRCCFAWPWDIWPWNFYHNIYFNSFSLSRSSSLREAVI